MNICFIGLSGVGKTTLIKALCNTRNYHVPVFTVTRPPRESDSKDEFEYVSVDEYLCLRHDGSLVLDMDDGRSFYGYQRQHIIEGSDSLMYGSPYQIEKMGTMGAKVVLVEGNATYGLSLRNDSAQIVESRIRANQVLSSSFYCRKEFRNLVDLFFYNDFSFISDLAEKLHKSIRNKLG